MSTPLSLEDQENVLMERITVINNEIRILESEKAVLQKHIHSVRKNNVDLRDVKRTNSVERAIVEKVIHKIISDANMPIKTRSIEINLTAAYLGVKPATFRSHLKRMENKGIIKSHKHGFWVVVK